MNKLSLRLRSTLIIAWITVLVAAEGCSDARPRTYPVRGTLKFSDGAPVRTGVVEFRSAEQGLNARGRVDRTGHFQLGTFSTSDGAVAGPQQVIVTQIVTAADAVRPPRDHKHTSAGDSTVAPKHARYGTLGLSARVEPQSSNEIELVVERRQGD